MKFDERAELRGRGLKRISLIMLEPINGVVQFRVEHILKMAAASKTFINFMCFNMSNVKIHRLEPGVQICAFF